MGLRIHAIELLEATKVYLPKEPVCYMIGTQDCGFTYRKLAKLYPRKSGDIRAAVKDWNRPCDLRTLFKVLGFKSIETIDINDRADIRIDLSKPTPEKYRSRADLVCDFGTLEHIFDVKTSIENLNAFLKIGGVIFHMSPVSFYQHGFFNFNPCFFDSLYSESGYKQIFKTMNISIYNPFYVIDRRNLPSWLRYFFAITNRIIARGLFYRYNLPLSRRGDNGVLSFFNFWASHFRIPKNLMYCCAYQKLSDELIIPYDIWK